MGELDESITKINSIEVEALEGNKSFYENIIKLQKDTLKKIDVIPITRDFDFQKQKYRNYQMILDELTQINSILDPDNYSNRPEKNLTELKESISKFSREKTDRINPHLLSEVFASDARSEVIAHQAPSPQHIKSKETHRTNSTKLLMAGLATMGVGLITIAGGFASGAFQLVDSPLQNSIQQKETPFAKALRSALIRTVVCHWNDAAENPCNP